MRLKYELKRLLFDLFDNSRVLFNDYYNGKEEYTDRDITEIYELILKIHNEDITEIEKIIEEWMEW